MHPVVFVDSSCGAEFVTLSTLSSEKKRDIAGVPHDVITIEISSASHPFYTGKQVLIDTARRVEKFEDKMKKIGAASAARKGKKAKKAKADAKKEAEKPKKAPNKTEEKNAQ